MIFQSVNYNRIETYGTMSQKGSIGSVAVSVDASVWRYSIPHAVSLLEVVLIFGHIPIVGAFIPTSFPVPEILVGVEALPECELFFSTPPIHRLISILMPFVEGFSPLGLASSLIEPDRNWIEMSLMP